MTRKYDSRMQALPVPVFLLAIAIILLLTACALKVGGITAALGQEFTLAIGESARIKSENLDITFLKVVEDSRCPLGVQCIQAGRARSLVRIVTSNSTEERELTALGLSESIFRTIHQEYVITFNLLPYPEAGKEITPEQYRLQMTVNRVSK